MSIDWDAQIAKENWKAPTVRARDGKTYPLPYMLFGTVVNNRESSGKYKADTPHLAEFPLIGSNKAAGRVQHYLKRGFKLLSFYVPEGIEELKELKYELERASGSRDQEYLALKAENERLKASVLDKKVAEKGTAKSA